MVVLGVSVKHSVLLIHCMCRETGEDYTEIIYENLTSVTSSAFDVNKITKVIVHGWLVSAFKSFEQELRECKLSEPSPCKISICKSYLMTA